MKQFGERAERVTTEEMNLIFNELKEKIGNKFCAFELTLVLEEKKDHGDIDILVLLHPDQNVKPIIKSLDPLDYSKNGYCYSFLYKSHKVVHIDFLVSSDPNLHIVKKQYYSFNVLSKFIGIMAKELNFKYSSEGFFKRYKDKRNNWHDILISVNLNPGLQCLGLEPKPLWIKTKQDILNYVSSSLLFDSSMFDKDDFIDKRSVLKDEDYFFKRQFPDKYMEVEDKKKEIESKVYRQTRFDGNWLMEKFGMKPSPELGKMLKLISDNFDDNAKEEVVIAFVREKLK